MSHIPNSRGILVSGSPRGLKARLQPNALRLIAMKAGSPTETTTIAYVMLRSEVMTL